ncbi:MAG: hypothetical protein ACRDTJ_15950, partial [Pseudonocardiaceae bacterium]
KGAPVSGVLRRRSRVARPMSAGRPHEPVGDGRPRWMTADRDAVRRPVHRIRLTGQLVRPASDA